MYMRNVEYTLGSKSTPVTLTNAYSGNVGDEVYIGNAAQVFVDVDYTMGATETSNSIQLKIEVADPDEISRTFRDDFAPAATDWRTIVTETISGGTDTLVPKEFSFAAVSAAGTYDNFAIDLDSHKEGRHTWIRVSAKETGVATNAGSARIKIVTIEEC